MGQPENDIPEAWLQTYMDYLGKASLYPVMGRGENLESLAKECMAKLART
eukprot:gene13185-16821_t